MHKYDLTNNDTNASLTNLQKFHNIVTDCSTKNHRSLQPFVRINLDVPRRLFNGLHQENSNNISQYFTKTVTDPFTNSTEIIPMQRFVPPPFLSNSSRPSLT